MSNFNLIKSLGGILFLAMSFTPFLSFGQDVKISQLKVSKVTENSFGPFVYNNEMYYCLDRGKKSTKSNENQGGAVFLDLFKIQLKQKNKTIGKPIRLSDTINIDQNEGPLEISPNGQTMYYSRNLDTFKDSLNENKIGIFISNKSNTGWSFPTAFKYNNEDYNVSNPTVNYDQDMMIFSSDNPSGLGGFDLYVSIKRDGEWGEPKNLGKSVNTEKGESFPYLVDKTLYFTSNREGGFGGMDLYKSIYVNGQWGEAVNLGEPLNSNLDDFCYFLNPDGKSGYFSSNRNGVSDGIYYFEKEIPEPTLFEQQTINFCYDITDEIMEEDEDLEFTWDLGDGTKLKGLEIKHCYQDTGVFDVRLSVYEKSMEREYFPAASNSIRIDAKGMPIIEYEDNNGEFTFTINSKWETIAYDNYYWEINGEKIFNQKSVKSKNSLENIRLVVWKKNVIDSTVGIELKLK